MEVGILQCLLQETTEWFSSESKKESRYICKIKKKNKLKQSNNLGILFAEN